MITMTGPTIEVIVFWTLSDFPGLLLFILQSLQYQEQVRHRLCH